MHYAQVDEIWDNETKTFNKENLERLLKLITGDENAGVNNVSPVDKCATEINTSKDMRERAVLDKTAEQDIVVTIGGLDWTATYFSKTKEGDPILTLWLANAEQMKGLNKGNGENFDGKALGSWTKMTGDQTDRSKITDEFIVALYSTSYLRTVTLNNGGDYLTEPGALSLGGHYDQDPTHAFAMFTMPEEGADLTDFISTPRHVGWQENGQNLHFTSGGLRGWKSNENWSNDVPDDLFQVPTYNYAHKKYNDLWADDTLWIPSLSELFISGSETEIYQNIWENSQFQNMAASSTWTRTPTNGSQSIGFSIVDSGLGAYSDGRSKFAGLAAVRPAFHLNLNKVLQNVNEAADNDIEYAGVVIDDHEWNDTALMPDITVTLGGKVLNQGEDFEVVAWHNNTEIGTASVEIKGSGTYTGTKTTYFLIVTSDFLTAEFEYPEQVLWTGTEQRPVVVRKDGRTLVESEDYDITYERNLNVQESTDNRNRAHAKIVGKGHYSQSSKDIYFNIMTVDLSEDFIEVSKIEDQIYYYGKGICPSFTVTDTREDILNQELVANNEFSYSWTSNVNVGLATLTIYGKNHYKNQRVITFSILPFSISSHPNVRVTLSGSHFDTNLNTFIFSGEAQKPNVQIQVQDTSNERWYDLKIGESVNLTIHKDTPDGDVTEDPIDIGTYWIVLEGIGNYNGFITVSYSIVRGDIANATISLNTKATVYNERAFKPEPTINLNSFRLANNVDYTYEYHKWTESGEVVADPIDAGQYYVVCHGQGARFQGTISAQFTISPASLEGATLVLDQTEFTYSGQEIRPTIVSVKTNQANNGLTVPETGYKITYRDNIKVGQATITLTGTGNYMGSVSANFNIAKGTFGSLTIWVGQSVGQDIVLSYSGEEISPTFEVRDENGEVILADEYVGVWTRESSVTSDFVTVGTLTLTIQPKEKDGSVNYYGQLTGSITLNPADISSSVKIEILGEYTYTGEAITPDYTISWNETQLHEGDDFSLEVSNNTDATSSALMVFTFKGNFSGEKTLTFVIKQKDINLVGVEPINAQEFTDKAIQPEPVVFDTIAGKRKELLKNSDYAVSWGRNVEKGMGTVLIDGLGNYTGSRVVEFEIAGKVLRTDMIFVSDVTYNGKTNKSSVTVMDGATVLQEEQDYTLEYQGNLVDAGTVTVVVTAVVGGNYAGFISVTYQILPKNLANANVQIMGENVYNREEQQVSFVATIDDLTLTDADFDVQYDNNINAGDNTASLTLKGKGNYCGTSAQFKFSIKAAQISGVTLEEKSAIYDGHEKQIKISSVTTENGLTLTADEYGIQYLTTLLTETDDFTNAGTIIVKVTSTGTNILGSAQASYIIEKATIEGMSLKSIEAIYDRGVHKPEVDKVWAQGGLELSDSDFDVSFTRDGAIETQFVNAGTIKVVVTVKADKNFQNGETEISAEFVIKQAELSTLTVKYYVGEEEFEKDQVFIGQQVVPKLYLGENEIRQDEGYDVEIDLLGEAASNFDKVGEYTLTISGKVNLTGTITKKYKVLAASFTPENVDYVVSDKTYTGSKVVLDEQDITLTYHDPASGDLTLVWGTHFNLYEGKTIEIEVGERRELVTLDNGYYANVNAGQANVFFQGIEAEGFTSTDVIRVIFNILPAEIDDSFSFEIEDGPFVYCGESIMPTLKTAEWNGFELQESRDYLLSYSENVNAGNATIKVKGQNNFAGEKELTFTIDPRQIDETTEQKIRDVVYNGEMQKPVVALNYKTFSLIEHTDYEIKFKREQSGVFGDTEDLTSAGKIRIEISGLKNYTGIKTIDFSILQLSLSDSSVSKNGILSNGKYVLPDVTYDKAEHKITPSLEFKNATLLEKDVEISWNTTDFISANDNIEVTAKGIGNFTGEVIFAYKILKEDINDAERISVKIDTSDKNYTGEAITVEIELKDGEDAVTFNTTYSNNVNVSYLSSEVSAGATVTVEGTGNYKGTIVKTFKILPIDLNDASIQQGSLENVVYDGQAHKLSPELTREGTRLVESQDFTIVYSTADFTNAQEISLVIKGMWNYTGTIESYSYTIERADISGSERFAVDKTWISREHTFTGSGIEFETSITDNVVTKKLTFNDVSIAFADNVDVAYVDGEIIAGAQVTFEGIGNYKGTLTEKFKIVPANLSEATVLGIPEQQYTGFDICPEVRIRYNGNVYTENLKTFSTEYSSNKDVGQATVTLTGRGNFTGSTGGIFYIVSKLIGSSDFEVEILSSPEELVYTGSAIEPRLKVKIKSSSVEIDASDYDAIFSSNTNAGEAKVVVILKNNYSGNCEGSFEIAQRSLQDELVTKPEIEAVTYDGSAHQIFPDIIFANEKLHENRDFDIEYNTENFVNVQNIIITLNGKENFKDSVSISYSIVAKDLGDADIQVRLSQNLVYTGEDICPLLEVTYGNMTLTEKEEYDFSYDDNVNAGSATLTITALSDNYTGSKVVKFEIVKKELTYSMLTPLSNFTYTGKDICPSVTLTYLGKTLENERDYTVSYQSNHDAGLAFVTIQATEGNYTGQIIATFNIYKRSISNGEIAGYEREYAYTETDYRPTLEITVDEIDGSLRYGEDYYIEYPSDTINVGQKELKIYALGNYTGTRTIFLTIVARDLSDGELDGFKDRVNYNNGQEIEQEIELKFEDIVISAANYKIEYLENVNAGQATMILRPTTENLIGEIRKNFEIEKIEPTITLQDEYESFVGEFIANVVILSAEDTPGEFEFEEVYVKEGVNEYAYTFTPYDERNFLQKIGMVKIKGNKVEVTGIEANLSKAFVNGDVFEDGIITVYIIYNNGEKRPTDEYTLNVEVGDILTAEIGIDVECVVNEKTYTYHISVLRTEITNGNFKAYSKDGFADNVSLQIIHLNDEASIREILQKRYYSLSKIKEMYIVTLIADGEPYTNDNVVLTCQKNNFKDGLTIYKLEDIGFTQLVDHDGIYTLGSGGEIYLIATAQRDILLIVLIVVGVVLLIMLIVLIRVLVLIKKKRKKQKLINSSNREPETQTEKKD